LYLKRPACNAPGFFSGGAKLLIDLEEDRLNGA
jgi:hypothetical protein